MNVVEAAKLPSVTTVAGVQVPALGSIGLRPESITLVQAGQGAVQAKVELIEALGAETLIYVTTQSGAQLVARLNTRTELHVGADVGVHIDADAAHLFDANG
eukprot:gene14455-14250_t